MGIFYNYIHSFEASNWVIITEAEELTLNRRYFFQRKRYASPCNGSCKLINKMILSTFFGDQMVMVWLHF